MLRSAAFFVGALVSVVAMAQDYAPASGPLNVVDTGRLKLHDATRDKDLPIRIQYPEADKEHEGPFPLVLFSHGAGGSCDAFVSLSDYLASNGYVVIHPTHSDSLNLLSRDERQTEGRDLLRNPRSIVKKVNLPDRVADVKYILDSLDDIERLIDKPGLIDRERMGMAGHSAGAMTTQVLGGMEFMFLGKPVAGALPAEARFDALAVISGAGTTRPSITEDSWQHVDRPWLVITGSKDVSAASDETPESRQHPYNYAPVDGTKYLLFIDGATHSSYQGKGPGLMLNGRPPTNLDWIAETTNMSVLAFFDAYVKGNEDAKAWLDGGNVAKREGGSAEFKHK